MKNNTWRKIFFVFLTLIFFKPQVKVSDGRCLDYEHPEVVQLLLNNLSKYQNVNPMKMISPKQDKNNCWFNTSFMVFFVSDLGRKFSKFFRHFCINVVMHNRGETSQKKFVENSVAYFCAPSSIFFNCPYLIFRR